jgi:hypothetical protein
MSTPSTFIYLTDFIINILDYYKTKYDIRNDYFVHVKQLIRDNTIDLETTKDECTFIRDKDMMQRIDIINKFVKMKHKKSIEKANKKDDKDPNKKKDYTQAGINELQDFIDGLNKSKLTDYLDTSPLSKKIIEKIKNITRKDEDNLTIGDLYQYFYVINDGYFNINIIQFLKAVYTDNTTYIADKIEEINTLLKNLQFKYLLDKSIPDPNIYTNLSILFSANFPSLNINYKLDDKKPFEFEPKISDFEQSDIIQYPNIKIFCTDLTDDNDIEKNLFNRFTYFHEIGHSYANGIQILNINGEKVCLNKKDFSSVPNTACNPNMGMFNYNFRDEIKKINTILFNDINTNKNLSMLEEIISPNNSFVKYLDIFSDVLAFSVIINDLQRLRKDNAEIFNYCIAILKKLHGNYQHFETDTRILINIYINLTLRTELERRINSIPVLAPLNQKDIIDQYLNFLTDISNNPTNYRNYDIDTSKPDLSLLDEDFFNKAILYDLITLNIFNDIVQTHTHTSPNYLDDIINYNKFKNFILELIKYEQIKLTDIHNYKQKYLKYKQKYLKLKNNMK